MSNVCIVLLCGIPGSGKTTFAELLLSSKRKSEINLPLQNDHNVNRSDMFNICFDVLLPASIEKNIVEEHVCGKETSKWKEYRQYIFQHVDKLISKFIDCSPMTLPRNKTMQQKNSYTSDSDHFLEERLHNLFDSNVVEGRTLPCTAENKIKIIIIDDNMYYRSMRYEYFQLARHYRIGFCQIYFPCCLEEAKLRNKQRANQVSDEIINGMALKLEEPCSSQNSWEKNTFTWNPKTHKIEDIFDFVAASLAEPVENNVEEQLKVKEESRLIGSSNLIHQADKMLRQLVKETILSEKVKKETTPMELQELAKKLNRAKTNILERMKIGDIKVTEHSLMSFEQTNNLSELQDFLQKEFKTEAN